MLTALFTAASAVCVTGLIVQDTPTYWSGFGQGVILALFQIGGFGIMTGATLLGLLSLLYTNRKSPLERLEAGILFSESMSPSEKTTSVSLPTCRSSL
ncbi:hypothetical protein IQ26_07337 [Mesorhizobium tianshanense]|uniref:Uncharacterized protein n=1 Tax=Mesorhizobium tianshanense TaxID=39844 RepID=A0A562MEB1_9HYPH|nr:hypothetical protein IQ26_07337 [Mesorhizobium tianshanense]